MVKQAELNLIKQAAFHEELEKLGGPVGLIGQFLLKQLPKLLMRGAKAVGGKRAASWVAKSEGVVGSTYRGLNTMRRSGTAYTGRQIYSEGISRAAKKWGTQGGLDFTRKGGLGQMEMDQSVASAVKGVNNPKAKNFFGIGSTRSSLGIDNTTSAIKSTSTPLKEFTKFKDSKDIGSFVSDNARVIKDNAGIVKDNIGQGIKNAPRKAVGQIAQNLNSIRTDGFGKYVKNSIQEGRTFTKDIKVNGVIEKHRFKKSIGGQAIGVSMTPVGWGAQELMSSTDEEGKKRGMVSRVGNAAAWTIAPRIATAKMIAGAVL